MDLRFYHCNVCGKVVTVLSETGIPTVCCGQTMQEMVPNRKDASFEKHVPVFSVTDSAVSVRIGSEPHPMTEEHHIAWIGVRTGCGFQFAALRLGDRPEAVFALRPEERVETVYACCNLHGLWCAE